MAASLAELLWSGPEGPAAHGVVPLVRGGCARRGLHVRRRAVGARGRRLRERRAGAVRAALDRPGVPAAALCTAGRGWSRTPRAPCTCRTSSSRRQASLCRRGSWPTRRCCGASTGGTCRGSSSRSTPTPCSRSASAPGSRHLLLVSDDGRLGAQPAGVVRETPGRTWLDLAAPPPPDGTPCVLFGQDASFPDLERWNQVEPPRQLARRRARRRPDLGHPRSLSRARPRADAALAAAAGAAGRAVRASPGVARAVLSRPPSVVLVSRSGPPRRWGARAPPPPGAAPAAAGAR